MDEAKQFYPLFGLGANVALIFSGRAVRLFSEIRAGASASLRAARAPATGRTRIRSDRPLTAAPPRQACRPAWTAGACP